MTKSFYAADNHYGTETDVGFFNTWFAIEFPSKAARDEFVSTSTKRSTRAIKAAEIKSYGGVSFRQSASGVLEQIW
jgi:hypothetical protein